MRYLMIFFLLLVMNREQAFGQDANNGDQGNIDLTAGTVAETVRFYPNPLTNVLSITPSVDMTNAFLFVSDVRGRVIAKTLIPHLDGGQEYQYGMNDLSTGIYVCVIQTGDKQFVQRIMVQ
ncbi:MAG: hypothetical protein FD123_1100 [Bacteroidetes bacterium]|nr:MAG: hypothetical protein FD123_1100 [Bacteroidota bacterium]